MQIPPFLNSGDVVGIVSTASKIEPDVVKRVVALLENMGYVVRIGNNVFAKHNQFAGTDVQRTADLQRMFDDADVRAVFCSRGGYGTLRTLQNLSWHGFEAHPKWVVGFSDVTVLHSALNKKKIASVHGVMPKYFTSNNEPSHSFRTLMNTLTGKSNEYAVPASEYNIKGTAKAELVGGNLSILMSLRGTPYDIDPRGKILFIEDLAEYYYHIDRIMMNLKTGGMLSQLKGLIVGGFTGLLDNDISFGYSVHEIILDAVKSYGYPVAFNFPAGHQSENYSMKMGCDAQLEVNDRSVIFKQK
ncbi:MAG: LD-carboxypeptidase [Prolixibacteraceae bacterium]|jgi:muramoyltetrapeptide carboxypeptidase|nr:LD-carboxypeptidase [Prolixibacteraceae bacterium]